jgi:putative lipase involved disintegration of autophagic bodies
LPIALFAVIIPFIDIAKSRDYTLPESKDNLPVIRLAEIEQNPNLLRKTGYTRKNVDWANRVSYDWSPLAPVQYEIDEHGIVNGELWADQSGVYSPSITTRYYKLTFGSMAENLIHDLVKRYVWRDNIEIKEVYHPEFAKVYLAEDGLHQQIFAYFDDQVTHVSYHGKAKIEDILPLLSFNRQPGK